MKINGRSFTKANEDVVVIPRADGDIVFKIVAILSDEPFQQLCPFPSPPKVLYPDGSTGHNPEDTEFKQAVAQWAGKKTNWTFVEALRQTDGIEWDKVKYDDPLSWQFWLEDLKSAFFTDNEITYISNAIVRVNNLNQSYLDEARLSFLAKQVRVEV